MTTLIAIPDSRKERVHILGSTPDDFILIPPSAHHLKGFREWVLSDEAPEKLRVSFLNGEIFLDMAKEDIQTHVVVKSEIGRGVMNLNREIDLGQFYGEGIMFTNVAAKVSSNPDGLFVSWETLEGGRARLVPRRRNGEHYLEIEGSPDWALEVISVSSAQKDTVLLRKAYHQARVQEYWLVDARRSELLFKILHWRKAGYVAAANENGWQHSRVFDRDFRLVRKRGRMALWQYTLEVRAQQA